ncbi:MAG: HD domain-containing protein [Proteobacteria bacterium]|nr:HD domain-containing protein [Pseudomonadota bacterium]MBU4469121.1 HD domain-containing protein [Pseudomonadota bacterium]MCG2752152.1 HD domain-containing protein [Desulfobacteraceae bacterium]
MKCPGQDMQYWKPGSIFEAKCPKCGNEVEFFKDDPTRTCKACGHRFMNPNMDFGCAAYCPFAEQCVGNLPPELMAQKQDLIKDRVAIEMKRYFKQDFKRIGHATRVARHAERIAKTEEANLAVVLIAAYLHDIGIPESERKYNSAAAKYQEIEGPPVARSILEKLGTPEALMDEVCDIIGHHHHPREVETLNFKVVYDADLIANLEDNKKESGKDPEQIEKLIQTAFLTPGGKAEAEKVFLAR